MAGHSAQGVVRVGRKPKTASDTEIVRLITATNESTPIGNFTQLVKDMEAAGIAIKKDEIDIKAAKTKVIDDKNNTIAMFSNGKLNADLIDAKTIVVNGLRAGDIDAENATISNLVISGSSRSPFVGVGGNIEFPKFNDNISLITTTKEFTESTLDIRINKDKTHLEQIGRVVHFVHYKWNGYAQKGEAYLKIPTGSGYEDVWFLEDGIKKKSIGMSKQCVTLLGLGDDKEFLGWLVLGKVDTETTESYGRNKKVLVYGKVTGTNTGASIKYNAFDGSTGIRVTRSVAGLYNIYIPDNGWFSNKDDIFVTLTGVGHCYDGNSVGKSPAKATLLNINKVSATYGGGYNIGIEVSDDETLNDGSFNFEISNYNDFDF